MCAPYLNQRRNRTKPLGGNINDMGLAAVDIRESTVLKDYKDTDRDRYRKEVHAYTELEFATPRLICHNEYWIEMERCLPILNIDKEKSREYIEPLRNLLHRI